MSPSLDKQAVTVLFDSFQLALDPGATATSQAKRCHLELTLNVPKGWQMTLLAIDYRGHADFANAKSEARLDTSVTLGKAKVNAGVAVLKGPQADDFSIRRELRFAAWSTCGGTAKIAVDTTAKLSVPAKDGGLVSLETTDVSLTHQYAIAWRKCKG